MAMELELMSFLSQLDLLVLNLGEEEEGKMKMPKVPQLIIQVISLVKSIDLDSLPKPESKLISLIKHIIYLGSSVTSSDPDWEFISDMTTMISLTSSADSYSDPSAPDLVSLVAGILDHVGSLDSDSELRSLILQVLNHARFESLCSLISLSPRLEVEMEEEKFRVRRKVQRQSEEKSDCDPENLKVFSLTGEVPTHFHCTDCNGEKHGGCDKALVEVKHSLHPKHSLQLVLSWNYNRTRKCYCCDEDLKGVFYYCSACDYAMNIACLEKPQVLSVDYPKWHEHTLALFSRHTSLTCDVCALTHSSCPFYICPPCGFVVHQSCFNFPHVIKISRHLHRISFTPSFDQGDRPCGVCQRKIDNDYGGYSCIKKDCSFAAHSKCATQRNVWDGEELEKVPEVEEEEVEPFVKISDGIIEHFCHPHHHLRLDEYGKRDYDENQHCQACFMPIYFGKFYSCTICDFILHEECASFTRKIQHPIHPHMLTLVGRCDDVMNYAHTCSACLWKCTSGFFYECDIEGCHFKLHVQCGTISEPLVHESHKHPLFLTSKPGEKRLCSVTKAVNKSQEETFNCIECDFSLCFECATLPQKVRYKHDKHLLTLSYGNEASVMMNWCEACEEKIDPKERVYRCDEYCCVSLHLKCLIGKDLYMKPGSSLVYYGKEVDVLPNNQHMSRPFCSYCKKRCTDNIVFKCDELTLCSTLCIILL